MSGWERLPVDDIGYLHPNEILGLSDSELRDWAAEFEDRRYNGWRNHDNLWRKTLGLDTTHGKHVVDFGCGFGIEALQFAKAGNRVTLMDLTLDGLQVARRVLGAHGYPAETRKASAPIPDADVFYSNGVLHHTPHIAKILKRASRSCREARLMVYSDRAYRDKGQTDFVRAMDEVGDHADWYTPDKLAQAADGWKLRHARYITPNGWYLAATLDPA